MDMNIALFPGSFDPITKGHESIVKRALPLFDKIVVGIGINSSKNYLFPVEKRMEWVKATFINEPKVEVVSYKGLTVKFCKEIKAQFILRGLRNTADFNFESGIAQMNAALDPEIESVFIMTNPELSAINATIVRDIIRNGGDVQKFVPENVKINL
ncbi:MAG: pantetheine-phosphate adenylyltransferase [Vicingaceae bacterium]